MESEAARIGAARIVTPIDSGEPEREADARLTDFITASYPAVTFFATGD
jgi:hypothetical protein